MVTAKEWIENNQRLLFEVAARGFAAEGRGLVFCTVERKYGVGAVAYVPEAKCEEATRLFAKALDQVKNYDVMEEAVVVVGKNGLFEMGAVLSRTKARADAGEYFN